LKASPEEKEEIRRNYRIALQVDSLDEVPIPDLMAVLENDSLIERMKYRTKGEGKKTFVRVKGSRTQSESSGVTKGNPNAKIGFKSTMYSVTESSGHVEITIVKKVAEEMAFLVKTEDDTAVAPDDYESVERIITMQKGERECKIHINIIDDEIWEPDKDFFVYICDENGVKKEGSDTSCKVTILDEDNPGVIGFEQTRIKVRKMEQYAFIRVVRADGSDGDVNCMIQTKTVDDEDNAAKEFDDFLPEERVLNFKHNENEQMVQIQLSQTANVPDESPNNPAINEGSKDGSANTGTKKDPDASDESSEAQEEPEAPKVFQVILDRPRPEGVRVSRQNVCYIEIVANDDQLVAADEI